MDFKWSKAETLRSIHQIESRHLKDKWKTFISKHIWAIRDWEKESEKRIKELWLSFYEQV